MQLVVLDQNLESTHVIDTVSSFIWTDRYCGFGDFEVVADPASPSSEGIVNGNYLYLADSEHLMIMESWNVYTNSTDGIETITSKGRSLESILDRRIIWDQTVLTGNFQDGIHTLLNDNIMDPVDVSRHISNFVFVTSTDPLITALEIDEQFFGENLYTVITDLCLSKQIGYKIVWTPDNEFHFSLYAGEDRSQAQFANPYVTFSPKFNNLVLSNHTVSTKFEKTVGLVAGEKGVGNVRATVTVPAQNGSGTGLGRKEIFVDAAGVTRKTPDGNLTDQEYADQLVAKGDEALVNNSLLVSVDGQIDPLRHYTFGLDFFMGDIVQVESLRGVQGRSRVTELIFSQDESGIKIFPTFISVD